MESKGPNDLAHAKDDVNPHILRMLEGTFSPEAAHTEIMVNLRLACWEKNQQTTF